MKKLILTICFCLVATLSVADEYYLGQWEWNSNPVDSLYPRWEAPHEEFITGAIDLRSIPQQSLAGGSPQGYAIFSYSQTVNGMTYLGNDVNGNVPNQIKNKLKNKLGITETITGSNFVDVLWEVLTVLADPTGNTRWKPLMPGVNGRMNLKLGRAGKIKEIALVPFESPEWDNVLAVLHNDYKRMLDTEPYRVIAKVLDFWEHKYKVPYQTFIPNGVIQIASLPHETTITESWNCSDSDDISCDLTWTQVAGDIDIVNNKARFPTNGGKRGRAESDLSSDDHYAQVDGFLTDGGSDEGQVGAMVRFDSAADNNYFGGYNSFSAPSWRLRIEKTTAGTTSSILGPDTSGSISTTPTVKLLANGSSIELFVDGSPAIDLTDSSHTGYVRAGIQGYDALGGPYEVDNFVAADLAAAGGRTRRMF